MVTSILILLLSVTLSLQRSVLQNNDCSYISSNYSINWTFDELSNDVVFKLSVRSSQFSNFYTAIGFGNDEKQATDVIAVYVRAAQIGLIDGHLAEDGAIESDEKTNVQALQFDLQDDILTAQFARPMETFDSEDADLGSCITMFLPTVTREIITGAPLELGENLQKIRVCDIAVTCATKMHNDNLVKRQEDSDVAPVCASAAENEKNRIEWKVDGELIRFSVFQNAKKGRWWTAIGVGESMSDLNMILLFSDTGKLKKQGIFRTEGKMQPLEVQYDGIKLVKDLAIVENGRAHFDLAIEKKFFLDRVNDQGCFTMQIAQLAGQYQPNFNIQKHQNTPQAIQVCNVDACVTPTEPPQEVDRDTEKKPESAEKVDVEASGAVGPTNEAPGNDLEGSGLPNLPVETGKSSTKAMEEAEERPLTGDDAPKVSEVPTPSTSSATPPPPSSAIPITPQASPFFLTITQNTLEFSPDPVFIVDNQTTEKANDSVEEKTSSSTKKAENTGCGVDHEDLKICESYFAEYLGKVNEWSEKHNMTITSHMWKACTLLSEVQHVTTMCCTIFRNTCATHLSL